MMRRATGLALAGALLVAAAPVKMAPADDKEQPVGAAARVRNGPDPLTKPSEDIGMAEDPPVTAPPAPPRSPATTPKAS